MFCWFINYFKLKESTFPNLCLTKFRYDGDFFVRNLDASVERSTKRGKGPRRTRYIQYCTWAHALLVRTYSCLALGYRCSPCKSMCHILTHRFVNFPSEKRSWAWRCRICVPGVVLSYIRKIVPGDVKGEIREVCRSLLIHQTPLFLINNNTPLLNLICH